MVAIANILSEFSLAVVTIFWQIAKLSDEDEDKNDEPFSNHEVKKIKVFVEDINIFQCCPKIS